MPATKGIRSMRTVRSKLMAILNWNSLSGKNLPWVPYLHRFPIILPFESYSIGGRSDHNATVCRTLGSYCWCSNYTILPNRFSNTSSSSSGTLMTHTLLILIQGHFSTCLNLSATSWTRVYSRTSSHHILVSGILNVSLYFNLFRATGYVPEIRKSLLIQVRLYLGLLCSLVKTNFLQNFIAWG